METKATYEQAQLQLKLYDLRRETKLRRAREWFFKNYTIGSLEDAMRIAGPGTETGTLAMMTVTYWEQACALLSQGLLHEELFFQTAPEFFGVWESVKPMVPAARQMFANKLFLANLEKAAQRYESWIESRSPGHVATMRQFMKQVRLQPAAASAQA